MKRIAFFTLITLGLSSFAFAGNGAPSGAHYNLNIIGVEKGKTVKMTDSNRHTIFVPLVTSGKGIRSTDGVEVHTQIWLAPSDRFRVCDGNGFDYAYGCADSVFNELWNVPLAECWIDNAWEECSIVDQRKEGAVFELPCNNNITDSETGLISCGEVPQASYEVWARALGTPKNDPTVTVTTCATIQDELQCSTENVMKTRTKGKSMFTDVTDALTSAVVDYCTAWDMDGNCTTWETTRIALFSGDTEDWFWNYVNNGVRLLQLRFYPQ